MARLDRRTAQLLVAALALVAVISFGQGLFQVLKAPRPEQVAAGVDPSRDPVPNAAALTGSPLDEARVRQIAREEAAAALGATRKKAAPAARDDDDASDDSAPARPPALPEAGAPASPSPAPPPSAPAPAAPPG